MQNYKEFLANLKAGDEVAVKVSENNYVPGVVVTRTLSGGIRVRHTAYQQTREHLYDSDTGFVFGKKHFRREHIAEVTDELRAEWKRQEEENAIRQAENEKHKAYLESLPSLKGRYLEQFREQVQRDYDSVRKDLATKARWLVDDMQRVIKACETPRSVDKSASHHVNSCGILQSYMSLEVMNGQYHTLSEILNLIDWLQEQAANP